MFNYKNILLLTFVSLTVFFSTAASALYIEFNPGYSDTGNATLNSGNDNFTRKRDQHFAWNVNLGDEFIGLLGAEVGYTKYADVKYAQSGNSGSANLSGYHLAVFLPHHFGPVFARIKLGYGHLVRGNVSINNINFNDKSQNSVYWGGALGMQITPSIYVSVQYQQTQGRASIPNAQLTSLGVGYSF